MYAGSHSDAMMPRAAPRAAAACSHVSARRQPPRQPGSRQQRAGKDLWSYVPDCTKFRTTTVLVLNIFKNLVRVEVYTTALNLNLELRMLQ